MGPTWVLWAPDGPHVGPWTLLIGTLHVFSCNDVNYYIDYHNTWESEAINPSHKSRYALDKYPTMQGFVTEKCTHMHISFTNGALLNMGLVGCGISATYLLLSIYRNHSARKIYKTSRDMKIVRAYWYGVVLYTEWLYPYPSGLLNWNRVGEWWGCGIVVCSKV